MNLSLAIWGVIVLIVALSLRSISIAYNPDFAKNQFNRFIGIVIGFSGLALIIFIIAGSYALAADGNAPVPTSSVNFSDVIMTLGSLIVAVLAAAAHAALRALTGYLKDKTRLNLDAATRAYIDPAIDNAVAYGKVQVQKLAAKDVAVDMHNDTVAHAVQYLVDTIPGALAHFGLTEDNLAPLVEARVGKFLTNLDAGSASQSAPVAAS